MSSQEGVTLSPRKQRYQRLPELPEEESEKGEHKASLVVVDNLRLDGDERTSKEDDETNSLVDADDVFRNPSSPSVSTTGTGTGGAAAATCDAENPALHLVLSKSRSHDSSDLDDTSDWGDDDEPGLRRYNLDFHAHTNIPLPAEFSHDSLPKRIWQSFVELQVAARQRRAARLLTMPSQSWNYQLHSCLLTWCCDATDRGILVVAAWLTAWILIGLVGRMGSTWWWMGLFLFIFRVSARRVFEYLQGKRTKRRQRLSTVDSVELGNPAVWSDGNNISEHGASRRNFREVA
jgi:hypothetical protein